MDRRTFLGTAVGATVPAIAGCFSGAWITGGSFVGSIESISTRHERGIHTVYANPVDDSNRETVAFEDVPDAAQREIAIAIVQGEYTRNDRDQIATAGVSEEFVTYRDRIFEVNVSVAETGSSRYPQFESDWFVPVELEATLDADRLTLSLSNVSDDRLQIGRSDFDPLYPPYFGPLIAWADDAYVLGHDAYERNDRIVTDDGPLHYYKWRRGPGDTLDARNPNLAPGETLEETYRVPTDIPEEASIWLLSHYRGPGVKDADPERGFGISWTITVTR